MRSPTAEKKKKASKNLCNNKEEIKMERTENNVVKLTGTIVAGYEYSHSVMGENFYATELVSRRGSGTEDIVKILVSERLIDVSENDIGRRVSVEGQYRSFNSHEEHGSKLLLQVFVKKIEKITEDIEENSIYLDGFICKPPIYRMTPLGREIADVLLAVNRAYGKSDYITCIMWGRNARFAEVLEVGSRIKVNGRIQSRGYVKKYEDHEEEKRAYEVSISTFELGEEVKKLCA